MTTSGQNRSNISDFLQQQYRTTVRCIVYLISLPWRWYHLPAIEVKRPAIMIEGHPANIILLKLNRLRIMAAADQ